MFQNKWVCCRFYCIVNGAKYKKRINTDDWLLKNFTIETKLFNEALLIMLKLSFKIFEDSKIRFSKPFKEQV